MPALSWPVRWRWHALHVRRLYLVGACASWLPAQTTNPTFVCTVPCRTHGDMELALDAHPTLQMPHLSSTTIPTLASAPSGC